MDRQVRHALAIATTAVTLTLRTADGCELDSAVVTAIPPATLHVVMATTCGALRCWSRWIVHEDRRLAEARACSSEGPRDQDRFEMAPSTPGPPALP